MAKSKKKLTVALVEDDRILAKVLNEELSEAGFNVVHAYNGIEAVRIVKAKKPDLILLDILMPKMDGITALKKLHQDKKIKEIPVVVLTNYDDPKKVVEFTQLGVYDYLVKSSWTTEGVIKKVKKKLNVK